MKKFLYNLTTTISLPTWIMTCIIIRFVPKTHDWYGRKFTLKDWNEHQTDYCRVFDIVLWTNVPLCLILTYKLFIQ